MTLCENEKIERTYRYDRLGAPLHGVLSSGLTTFGLLICIRYFDAPDSIKALVAAGTFIGFLFNGYSSSLASRLGRRNTTVLAFIMFISGLLLVGSSFAANLVVFLCFFVLAKIIFAQQPPFKTHLYMMNYPARLRGTRSSAFFALSAFGGVTFSVLGGYLLDQNMSYFRIIILLMAVSCFVYAFLFLKIPGSLLSERGKQFSLRSFTLLWQDRLFGSMIMAWFLLGFGNLMMIPLRVEYIANPIYGINASNEMVAIITIVIPSIAAILSTRVWGVLFDRIHFAVWRNGVNVCFVVSILIFFNTHALLWLFIASFIDGIARGGAFLGWSLWVTKIAPPDKIPQYMSIHTAATGIRGVLAPFLGFFLIYEIHPQYTSWIAVFLIVLSIIIFSFMYRVKRLASRH